MNEDVFEEFSEKEEKRKVDEGVDAFNDSVDRGKEVKCPSCGSNMAFDPNTQTLKCPHCGSEEDFLKDVNVNEISIEKAFEKAEKWDQAVVVRCENCGAKIVIGADEVAKECPYCGTSQIKKTDEIAGIRPNVVYPFTFDVNEAEVKAKKWSKKRIFAPSKFKKNIEAKNVKGIFEPVFTFDSYTVSTYRGVIGERRTREVGSGKNRRTETYIHWENVSGTIDRAFDDVTISASRTLPQDKLNKMLPLPIKSARVYEKKFLAGYHANHYTRNVKDCWADAKSAMDAEIRQAILRRYNCDVIKTLNVWTTHNNVTYKYVLMPLYQINYHYGKKDYLISVNGTSGKVAGKTPVSPLRVAIAVLLGLAALAGVIYFYYTQEGDTVYSFAQKAVGLVSRLIK